METKIKTLGRLFARSFHVDLDHIRRPGDRTAERLVIRHPSAVVVVPLVSPDETVVVTQYRYALGRETVEFPAGKLEPGEAPETAALRELAEETGYRAGRIEPLLSFAPSVGYSTEIIHAFVARNLTRLDEGPDPDEIARVEIMRLDRLKELVRAGEIIDGTTMLALAACEWLAGGPE
ncbi:MAG: NUDIX hydrolase [Proteobacteria bacterium]|nr:NUDIX hydrolase [Pseudomonadota bacterium]